MLKDLSNGRKVAEDNRIGVIEENDNYEENNYDATYDSPQKRLQTKNLDANGKKGLTDGNDRTQTYRTNATKSSMFQSDFDDDMIYQKYTIYWVNKKRR